MLSERIKKIRLSLDLSQSQLARLADISNDYMHKIESGKVDNIGTQVVESIAAALKVHPSLLLFGKVMTPEISLEKPNDIGPFSHEENLLILNYRKISSKPKREAVQLMCRAVGDETARETAVATPLKIKRKRS